jgi:hypothetical protein
VGLARSGESSSGMMLKGTKYHRKSFSDTLKSSYITILFNFFVEKTYFLYVFIDFQVITVLTVPNMPLHMCF